LNVTFIDGRSTNAQRLFNSPDIRTTRLHVVLFVLNPVAVVGLVSVAYGCLALGWEGEAPAEPW